MDDVLAMAERQVSDLGLLDSPGSLLYSSVETLRPGPVYLLGLNPGGNESLTLRDSIERSRQSKNAYLDEQWSPGGILRPRGQALLQRRVHKLCTRMGLSTRDVPASNLVFTRSARLNKHGNFKDAISICMPIHVAFIEAIKPRFLMTYGALENFERAVSIESIESRHAEHGSWMAHRGTATVAGRKISFGNTPHLSVWATGSQLNLAYNINIVLPDTRDIDVFNAIFRSLRDHLLR